MNLGLYWNKYCKTLNIATFLVQTRLESHIFSLQELGKCESFDPSLLPFTKSSFFFLDPASRTVLFKFLFFECELCPSRSRDPWHVLEIGPLCCHGNRLVTIGQRSLISVCCTFKLCKSKNLQEENALNSQCRFLFFAAWKKHLLLSFLVPDFPKSPGLQKAKCY